MKKIQIFYQNHGLTPSENANFATLLIPCFYHLERLVFDVERHERCFMGLFNLGKTENEKISNF